MVPYLTESLLGGGSLCSDPLTSTPRLGAGSSMTHLQMRRKEERVSMTDRTRVLLKLLVTSDPTVYHSHRPLLCWFSKFSKRTCELFKEDIEEKQTSTSSMYPVSSQGFFVINKISLCNWRIHWYCTEAGYEGLD